MIEFPIYKTLTIYFGDFSWGIPVYAICAYLAFLVGSFLFLLEARKKKMKYKDIFLGLGLIMVFLVIGARLLYFFGPDTLHKTWSMSFRIIHFLAFWNGGLVFYGGFFGCVFAIWLFCRIEKLSFWKLMDMWVAPMALSLAIARWGCFLADDPCRGSVSNLPWAVIREGVARHPAPVYESLGMVVLFFILLSLKKKKHFPGFLILFAITYYAIMRFFLEIVRIEPPIGFGMTTSQWISILILPLSILLFFKLSKKTK